MSTEKGVPKDNYSVFVGHLLPSTTKAELNDLFQSCGTIVEVFALQSKDTAYTYGFVRFAEKEAAIKAVQELNKWPMRGVPMIVDLSRETKQRLENEGVLQVAEVGASKSDQDVRCKTKESNSVYIDDVINLSRLEECCSQMNLQATETGGKPIINTEKLLHDISEAEYGSFLNFKPELNDYKPLDLQNLSKRLLKSEFGKMDQTVSAQETKDFFLALDVIMDTVKGFKTFCHRLRSDQEKTNNENFEKTMQDISEREVVVMSNESKHSTPKNSKSSDSILASSPNPSVSKNFNFSGSILASTPNITNPSVNSENQLNNLVSLNDLSRKENESGEQETRLFEKKDLKSRETRQLEVGLKELLFKNRRSESPASNKDINPSFENPEPVQYYDRGSSIHRLQHLTRHQTSNADSRNYSLDDSSDSDEAIDTRNSQLLAEEKEKSKIKAMKAAAEFGASSNLTSILDLNNISSDNKSSDNKSNDGKSILRKGQQKYSISEKGILGPPPSNMSPWLKPGLLGPAPDLNRRPQKVLHNSPSNSVTAPIYNSGDGLLGHAPGVGDGILGGISKGKQKGLKSQHNQSSLKITSLNGILGPAPKQHGPESGILGRSPNQNDPESGILGPAATSVTSLRNLSSNKSVNEKFTKSKTKVIGNSGQEKKSNTSVPSVGGDVRSLNDLQQMGSNIVDMPKAKNNSESGWLTKTPGSNKSNKSVPSMESNVKSQKHIGNDDTGDSATAKNNRGRGLSTKTPGSNSSSPNGSVVSLSSLKSLKDIKSSTNPPTNPPQTSSIGRGRGFIFR
ncbi:uncharacterized protein LOC126831110 [Patella vulgata]|uniref:uncharacterized protein LOC126831110 n=1 Tax=Patella vulgata TaxID=6465 RepID=UPI0021807F41|nr:uncharacterized protein LOC126831110 [Patella vulgata]XP_050417699.1 uncharacterized protein LOC126831110 [Patella vulgata]XP_055958589.1 uncharacterized protein LOC126831110 [Patella vulgata]